jgi:hypothetical protein
MIVLHALVALVVIVITTRLVGYLFQRLDQPSVIGELVGGILLGPSLLGWVAPEVSAWLLPPSVMPLLRLHAQTGVIFFMFLVGLELDGQMIRRSSRATSSSRGPASRYVRARPGLCLYAAGTFGAVHTVRCSSASRCRSPHSRCRTCATAGSTTPGNVAMACAAVGDVGLYSAQSSASASSATGIGGHTCRASWPTSSYAISRHFHWC